MKRFFILLLVALTTLVSCKKENDKKNDSPTQMQQVMAVHDEVMPKMGTISKLVEELKSKTGDSIKGADYEKAMKDLQNAHKAMMDWMKGFGERFDHEEILKGKPLNDEKKEWLNEEEVKVEAMKEKVNTSIQNAENLLKN
ncbi:hypothetical protein [Ascidiimonas sp. W6]|uniref:hypothetical protein n=1 Tax=Ascidiimonas meishanensis TaxID=3128903 RepID=UPI0030EDABE7